MRDEFVLTHGEWLHASERTRATSPDLSGRYLADDRTCLQTLLPEATFESATAERVADYAARLITAIRRDQQHRAGVDALLQEYSLSSDEGVVLMCLAEALLRVPDDLTADRLIADKILAGNWSAHVGPHHIGHRHSLFVNASAWGLLISGQLVRFGQEHHDHLLSVLRRTVKRLGQPVIREAARYAMRLMGDAFVMGQTIDTALSRGIPQEAQGYSFSYDMLGEGARTAADTERYLANYRHAIEAIGRHSRDSASRSLESMSRAGISVKLSALHPRYEVAQRSRVLTELVPRLLSVVLLARNNNLTLTLDAEEAARLELSLEVFAAVFSEPALKGWDGFGLAVQAYQKRAPDVIAWLQALAQTMGRRIPVRLVKGAYWDAEIKLAQTQGLADYPVYTRKAATDVAYLACAKRLLAGRAWFFPQFATHNAHSVAAILEMDEQRTGFEFQRLHGMGEALYGQLLADTGLACRIYAPVGKHADLLAYLVRRLLENGANTSFVNQVLDARRSVSSLIGDPRAALQVQRLWHNPAIPRPPELFATAVTGQANYLTGPRATPPARQDYRTNAAGFCWSDSNWLRRLRDEMQQCWRARLDSLEVGAVSVFNPARKAELVGRLDYDSVESMGDKLAAAHQAFDAWRETTAHERADILRRLADSMESHREEFMLLCVKEAGKTLPDSLAEIREAVDFCRFYAQQIDSECSVQIGSPRGVVLCISPWNFPLAIFVGQVVAALAAGNCVLAKPAEQTSLTAVRAVQLMYESGLPTHVVEIVLGPGRAVGEVLIDDQRIQAVSFTGSVATARWLSRALADRCDAPVAFTAETGGVNAMVVDSTALPEQVVDDVIRSGFRSAGQRCSALRVLFLQEETAPAIIAMLKGAMDELCVGDPCLLATDVGPVIDERALQRLQTHLKYLDGCGRLLHRCEQLSETQDGTFFAPHLYEIDALSTLPEEVFGPIVHVIRYRADQLDQVVDQINASGYGLTLGIHSRVQSTVDIIASRVQVGNVYVNRDMVGAVVGVQPFGGRRYSGTGPKVGGPNSLKRLVSAGSPVASTEKLTSKTYPFITCLHGFISESTQRRLTEIATVYERDYAEPQNLPGPTGESNRLLYEPRGHLLGVYTQGDAIDDCLAAVFSALLMGNRVSLKCPAAWYGVLTRCIETVPERFVLLEKSDGNNALSDGDIQGVFTACTSIERQGIARLLAQREGVPVPLIAEQPCGYSLYAYAWEKVVTINTTAAGGNAALMTLGSSAV
ncbi:bifunctional proline dehydrogenase/L-glutamate gamma-semialdehyde dehydrogenase PutA [Litorivivens sp.]|uniref:bifunctional proline dehydrogenase/L-glutamate gamma-semialdehyde dehydrogenase PutA n=2 Tax=Litorivivens sp. TaxID=2020868 RepID=UPI00356343C8